MSGEVLFTDTDYLSEDEIADLLGISRFPFLLPEEAAERIGISRHKIMELARERKIHHYRFSPRVIRFDPVHMELLRDPTALRRAKQEDNKRRADAARVEVDERLKDVATFVYFVQMRHSRSVKVGIANDITVRLRSLQNGNPEDLAVICSITGDYPLEQSLHLALKPWRLRGEWFSWCEPLERAVADLNSGKNIVDVIMDICTAADELQEQNRQ